MARATQQRVGRSLEGVLERTIPHNLEVEESLLGAMLLSRDAISDAIEFCVAGDFHKPSHTAVFEAITALHSRGDSIDPVSVADELIRQNKLELVGGIPALVSLQANTPTIASAARYARIVEEYSLLRKLIKVASEIADIAYSVPEDVGGVIDLAESLIFEVSQRKSTDSVVSIKDVLLKTLDDLQAQYENPDSITGIATGFSDLDAILSGLQRSALVIVGARPGMGKTSFALGIASHVACRSNLPVLVFSLEMSHMELTQRILSSEARVDSRKMRNGNLTEEDWTRISRALGQLGDAPIYIDDNAQVTILDIRAKARRLKAMSHGLGLVVVDYLQLMSGGYRSESRQVEVSEISRGLKLLARELDVPVLALSQLSRNLEFRADKRPTLADLRESGCVGAQTKVGLAGGTSEIEIETLYLSQGASLPRVLSFDGVEIQSSGEMTSVRFSGIKPLYRLTLSSGKEIEATLNHKFFTRRGWKMLWQLNMADELAVYSPNDRGSISSSALSNAGDSFGRGDLRSKSAVLDRSISSSITYESPVSCDFIARGPTYDISVVGYQSFIANDIVVHNSLEQDADVVMFIYRDELYVEDSPDKGIAEVIVAKHRNGPQGMAKLAFLNSYTRFSPIARQQGQQ